MQTSDVQSVVMARGLVDDGAEDKLKSRRKIRIGKAGALKFSLSFGVARDGLQQYTHELLIYKM